MAICFCSNCGNKVTSGFIFCDKCGAKLDNETPDKNLTSAGSFELNCPHCSTLIDSDAKFCKECGKPLTQIRKCTKCGNFLAHTSLFCGHCGEPVPKSCPKCGHVFQKEEKFCPKCGCSANATKPGSFKNPFDENPQPQNTFSTTETTSSSTPLCRVQEGKILAGVCSGLQAKFNLNVWIFRLLFIFTGIGLPIYIVLAIVLKYDDPQMDPNQDFADTSKNIADASSNDPWTRAGKDKTITIILSIFLGALGVDRFYLGYTQKGILKLLFPFLIILVGIIFLILSQFLSYRGIEVVGIIAMILAAILGIVTVIFYIADIVRLLTGKLLPKAAVQIEYAQVSPENGNSNVPSDFLL